MFSGLCGFPMTPMDEEGIDETAYAKLVGRMASAGVGAVCALGSTGNYAYLGRQERARVARLAVDAADGVPVMVGIGACRTRDVLALAEDAEKAGASALLLAPVSYHALHRDEVFGLYERIAGSTGIPLCLYDNPGATRFHFDDDLYASIARLPGVRSLKIPPLAGDEAQRAARVADLRRRLAPGVTIGASGDSAAVDGLLAGCDLWYSVIGGLFPKTALELAGAARAGDDGEALRLSRRLQPLWTLFDAYGGSLRVVAAAAHLLGLTKARNLPAPLRPIDMAGREMLARLIDELGLH